MHNTVDIAYPPPSSSILNLNGVVIYNICYGRSGACMPLPAQCSGSCIGFPIISDDASLAPHIPEFRWAPFTSSTTK